MRLKHYRWSVVCSQTVSGSVVRLDVLDVWRCCEFWKTGGTQILKLWMSTQERRLKNNNKPEQASVEEEYKSAALAGL